MRLSSLLQIIALFHIHYKCFNAEPPTQTESAIPSPLRRILVSPEHKFLLCPIEKSGSTLWRQLFLRLHGDPHWYEPPYHKRVADIGQKYSKKEVLEMFRDPNWTKAIFFRDPSLRLYSAYSHLIKHPTRGYPDMLKKFNMTTEWHDFWSVITSRRGPHNPHWQSQTEFCSFHNYKTSYNFVGNLEHLSDHGTALLKRVGVYDTYAANGWSLASMMKIPVSPNRVPGRYSHLRTPSNYNQGDCMFCKNHAFHKTNAASYSNTIHMNESVWSAIMNNPMYRADYITFRTITAGPMDPKQYDQYPFIKSL